MQLEEMEGVDVVATFVNWSGVKIPTFLVFKELCDTPMTIAFP